MKLKELTRGKGLVRLQSIILLVLVLVMLFMSFGTVFTLKVEMNNSLRGELEEILQTITDSENLEIPAEIKVNFMTFIKSIASITKIVKAAADTAKNEGENVEPLTDKDIQDLVNNVTFAYVALYGFIDVLKTPGGLSGNSSILAKLIPALISFVCTFYLMIIAIRIFIMLLFASIKAVRSITKTDCDAGEVVANLDKSIHNIIKIFPQLIIIRLLSSNYAYGTAIVGIFTLSVAALALGVVVSRLKKYEPADFKFLNVFQLISLVSVIGLALFAFSILKTNIFIEGIVAVFDIEFFKALIDKSGSPNFTALIMLVFLIVTISSAIKAIPRVLTRVACMSKSKSIMSIPVAVVSFLAAFAPLLLKSTDDDFALQGEAKSKFTIAIVGLVIMLVAEIALKVLPDKLCADCSVENRQKIITGAYFVEFADEAAPAAEPVAEAPAAEAEAEKPTEETVQE